jgi:hypothetical protein
MPNEADFEHWMLPLSVSRMQKAPLEDLSTMRICMRCGVAVFPDWIATHERWHNRIGF